MTAATHKVLPPGVAEVVDCNNAQYPKQTLNRAQLVETAEKFCTHFKGHVLNGTDPHPNSRRISATSSGRSDRCNPGERCPVDANLELKVINGCRVEVDRGGPNDQCGRIFRRAIDECDTEMERWKSGGQGH